MKFENVLEQLKTAGSGQEVCFTRALELLKREDPEVALESVRAARDTVERLVESPQLFASGRCMAPPAAALLLGALGFGEATQGRYIFSSARTPAALRRLAFAVRALDAWSRDEVARHANARFDALSPEPEIGAAGTTVLRFARATRRFASDDRFEAALPWLSVVANMSALRATDLEIEFPRRDLLDDDERKTLHALGLWPSATLGLVNSSSEHMLPPTSRAASAHKPKPSDLFKAVTNRHRGATSKRTLAAAMLRRENHASPAPAPA